MVRFVIQNCDPCALAPKTVADGRPDVFKNCMILTANAAFGNAVLALMMRGDEILALWEQSREVGVTGQIPELLQQSCLNRR